MGKFHVALVIGALFFASIAFGQQSDAVVSGTVTDPSGAHIVNASVTAANVETGLRTPVQTNEAGVYTMPALSPGKYTFTAEHAGFRKAVLNDVVLQVGSVLTL